MHSIAVENLGCRRGDRRLFEGMTWSAGPGTLVAVKGPNGSGKTTLLRVLAGFGLAETGRVTWSGIPVREMHGDSGWIPGWVGHADGLKADLTPHENLEFHRDLQRRPASGVDEALARMGIGPAIAHLPCRVLSAGQRRRTALARLLVGAMDPWLLDEPTSALDQAGDGLVEALLDEYCARGGIAVVASHRPLRVSAPVVEVTLE